MIDLRNLVGQRINLCAMAGTAVQILEGEVLDVQLDTLGHLHLLALELDDGHRAWLPGRSIAYWHHVDSRSSHGIDDEPTVTEHGAWLASMGYWLPPRRALDAIHDVVGQVRIHAIADAVSITVNPAAEAILDQLDAGGELPSTLWAAPLDVVGDQSEDVVVRKVLDRDRGDVS